MISFFGLIIFFSRERFVLLGGLRARKVPSGKNVSLEERNINTEEGTYFGSGSGLLFKDVEA